MALFSRTKAKTVEGAPETVSVNVSKAQVTDRNVAAVLVRPLITEKAVNLNSNSVYTFMVAKNATKYTVATAVTALYKVTPVKVNIVNKKPTSKMVKSRGREVSVAGYKKAYVYLKKGDTITLV
ncbi:MAG: 50S ribosomal protein L23 [Patescibacteria group bacterium]